MEMKKHKHTYTVPIAGEVLRFFLVVEKKRLCKWKILQ